MKKTFSKIVMTLLIAVLGIGGFAACSSDGIMVMSREAGSGTRGAFFDIIGIKDEDLVEKAILHDSTGKLKTAVSTEKKAIGYISLGSLDDTVKALKVGGVEASAANVKNDTYKLYRPFNLVRSAASADDAAVSAFYAFFASKEAHAIIKGDFIINGTESTTSYTAVTLAEGSEIIVAGSTSVTPLMEKLKAKFEELQSNVTIKFENATGSGAGITNAKSGAADIGMVSRELKDTEKTDFPTAQQYVLALDGIAVIVHKDNKLDNVTIAQLAEIYKGETTSFPAA